MTRGDSCVRDPPARGWSRIQLVILKLILTDKRLEAMKRSGWSIDMDFEIVDVTGPVMIWSVL